MRNVFIRRLTLIRRFGWSNKSEHVEKMKLSRKFVKFACEINKTTGLRMRMAKNSSSNIMRELKIKRPETFWDIILE